MKDTNVFDYALIAVGTWYSVANIEQILGIVLFIIQIGWILIKLGYSIYTVIKENGDLNEVEDEVNDVKEFIENIIEKEDEPNERSDEQK